MACHIVPVLDELQITIPTTGGTGHGSSHATDGSGIARYGGSTAHLRDNGTTLFSGHAVTGSSTAASHGQPPRASETREQRDRIERFFDSLRERDAGRRLNDAYEQFSREIGYLVRNRRQVTVAWHRNRGPAFLAGFLDHLRGNADAIPLEIGGVSRAMLLSRMEAVLLAHGSKGLRSAIQRHRDDLMRCADAATAKACIDILHHTEEKVLS
jgi:hypothetical protein